MKYMYRNDAVNEQQYFATHPRRYHRKLVARVGRRDDVTQQVRRRPSLASDSLQFRDDRTRHRYRRRVAVPACAPRHHCSAHTGARISLAPQANLYSNELLAPSRSSSSTKFLQSP